MYRETSGKGIGMSIDDLSPEQLIDRFFHVEMNSDEQNALAKLLATLPRRGTFSFRDANRGTSVGVGGEKRKLEQRNAKDVNLRGEENAGASTRRRYLLAAVSLAAMLLLAFGLGRLPDNSATRR